MAFDNQGASANYQSTFEPLKYVARPYTRQGHEKYTAQALSYLSEITECKVPVPKLTSRSSPTIAVDFEQPRALWQKVLDDTQKEHFVNNVAGHLGNARKEVQAAQRTLLPEKVVRER